MEGMSSLPHTRRWKEARPRNTTVTDKQKCLVFNYSYFKPSKHHDLGVVFTVSGNTESVDDAVEYMNTLETGSPGSRTVAF